MLGFDSEDVEEMEQRWKEFQEKIKEERKNADRGEREKQYRRCGFRTYDKAYDEVDLILERNYNGEINDAKALELIHDIQTETYQELGHLREHFFPEDFENVED